ncbi:glycosyl transferase, group 1 family protein, partial [mine drainage metagenome]
MDQEVLVAQHYSPEDDIAFITALEPLLRDPRYIRVDSKPLIVLYRPSILPDAAATLRRWREYCRKVGIGEIFLAMVQFDVEDPRIYGFDTAIEFPPHKLAKGLAPINDQLQIVNPRYSGYVIDYQSVIERARQHEAMGFHMIRGVFPSWDNEARKPGQGYTFANSTPERYREWLAMAADYARQHPVADGESLVFINAWNEWGEGAYLEPDRRYGYAYLQATRGALQKRVASQSRRIVIVSHDAHSHGAQYLALHMAREFKEVFGFKVDVVLLGEGRLRGEFERWATLHDLAGVDPQGNKARQVARGLADAGIEMAIANTTVSGPFAKTLNEAGLRVIGLVHELPGVIEQNRLAEHARSLAACADRLVFPAAQVRQGFERCVRLDASKVSIRPQGLYKLNRYAVTGGRERASQALRNRLNIPALARVILCVGYADRRKGIDLFVEIGKRLMQDRDDVHFLWVGHFDVRHEPAIRDAVCAAGLQDRFHFPGIDADTDLYYAGADVYALTSREDPFPSVVMEALQVGVPVVGFEGAGGFASLLGHGAGVLVPAFDTAAFACALRGVLDEPVRA